MENNQMILNFVVVPNSYDRRNLVQHPRDYFLCFNPQKI